MAKAKIIETSRGFLVRKWVWWDFSYYHLVYKHENGTSTYNWSLYNKTYFTSKGEAMHQARTYKKLYDKIRKEKVVDKIKI